MIHPLTEVIAEIQHCRASIPAPWFQERTAKWIAVIEEQVARDLSTVDVLQRLDAKADALTAARQRVCETMGLDPVMPLADLLNACDVVFRGFMELPEPAKEPEHAA